MALGVENLKKVVVAVIKVANKTDEVLQDGFQPFADFFALVSVAGDVFSVLKNLKDAYQEFLDLDAVEKTDILATVKAQFDIEDDLLEEVVEDGFEVVTVNVAFALKVRAALKK